MIKKGRTGQTQFVFLSGKGQEGGKKGRGREQEKTRKKKKRVWKDLEARAKEIRNTDDFVFDEKKWQSPKVAREGPGGTPIRETVDQLYENAVTEKKKN